MTVEVKLNIETRSYIDKKIKSFDEKPKQIWLLKPESIIAIIGLAFGFLQWYEKNEKSQTSEYQLKLAKARSGFLTSKINAQEAKLNTLDTQLEKKNIKLTDAEETLGNYEGKISKHDEVVRIHKETIQKYEDDILELVKIKDDLHLTQTKLNTDVSNSKGEIKKAQELKLKADNELTTINKRLGALQPYFDDTKNLSSKLLLDLISPRLFKTKRDCSLGLCTHPYNIILSLDYPSIFRDFNVDGIEYSCKPKNQEKNDANSVCNLYSRIENVQFKKIMYKEKNSNKEKEVALNGGALNLQNQDDKGNIWFGVYDGIDYPTKFEAHITLTNPNECFIVPFPRNKNTGEYKKC